MDYVDTSGSRMSSRCLVYLVGSVILAVLADQIDDGHLEELVKVGDLVDDRLKIFHSQFGCRVAQHDKGIALASHVSLLQYPKRVVHRRVLINFLVSQRLSSYKLCPGFRTNLKQQSMDQLGSIGNKVVKVLVDSVDGEDGVLSDI